MALIPRELLNIGADLIDSRQLATKLKILESALKIIMRKGIQSLTLAELARESRFSKPRIAYHYSKMDDVVIELFHLMARIGQETTRRMVEQSKTVEQKLESMARAACEWMSLNPEFARFFLMIYSYAPNHPKVYELHLLVLKTGTDRIVSILEQAGVPEKIRLQRAKEAQNLILGTMFRLASIGQPSDLRAESDALAAAVLRVAGLSSR